MSFLSRDTSYQEQDTNLYTFNMAALMDHLKHQGEQNKSASYFNIDILKYQVGCSHSEISGRLLAF